MKAAAMQNLLGKGIGCSINKQLGGLFHHLGLSAVFCIWGLVWIKTCEDNSNMNLRMWNRKQTGLK